jgi:hypothetical protein
VPTRLLLEHANTRELLPRYLAAAYPLTSTMVPLMECALERALASAPDDPVAAGLAEYLERHIPEETHSEEPGGAARDDLRALGIDADTLLAQRPSAKMAALIGSQYFWIYHYHPVAILGFLELEAYHPQAATVERLIEKTGYPREGFRQLVLHAKLDAVHGRDLHRVLDSLPLEWWHEQLIEVSAIQSICYLIDAMLDVVQDSAPIPVAGRS